MLVEAHNGMDLSALSHIMGHSSVTITTDVYAAWVSDGLLQEYQSTFNRAVGVSSVQDKSCKVDNAKTL
jgi:integrase